MLRVTIENEYKQKLSFYNNLDYKLLRVTGLTPVNATINRSKVAKKAGTRYNSATKNERNIVLTIAPQNDIEKSRVNLYKYIKTEKYIKLYLETKTRCVYIEGYVESMEGDLYTKSETLQVSIICPDPAFKTLEPIHYQFANVNGLFEFPFNIEEGQPIEISTITNYAEVNVENIGEEETGVLITMTFLSTVAVPTIYNLSTNESFKIDYGFNEGDVVTINTREGEKSITLKRGDETRNILFSVARGSKWFTLNVGENIFTFTTLFGAENLLINIELQPLYEGV